jgi:hypothetical protein
MIDIFDMHYRVAAFSVFVFICGHLFVGGCWYVEVEDNKILLVSKWIQVQVVSTKLI